MTAIINPIKLTFGIGNAKLSTAIGTFSLPAGHSCPFAKECLSKADRATGKIIDGKHCKFRCFAASQESTFQNIRAARWKNFESLQEASTIEAMGKLIQKSIPKDLPFVRVHVSGDHFNEKYFLAWLNVALNNPTIIFYGYTKATPFLVKYKKHIPHNFRFTASIGGTCDNLISKHSLISAKVVFSVKEAEDLNLEIDHDDSKAIRGNQSFALLLHGTQAKGTDAGKAWIALRRAGIGGYGNSKISRNMQKIEPPYKVYVTLKDGKVFIPSNAGKLIFTKKEKYA